MKKRFLILIAILLTLLCLTACSKEDTQKIDELQSTITSLNAEINNLKSTIEADAKENENLKTQINSLENDKKNLEEEVKNKESQLNIANDELEAYKKAEEEAKKESLVQEGDVEVLLIGKGNNQDEFDKYEKYSYLLDKRITFVFEVKNNTTKDIKGVQGIATIMDMFGKEVVSSNCDFTGKTIPAGGSITVDTLSYELNRYRNEELALYDTDYNDLLFKYQVTAIVFTDGTSKIIEDDTNEK